MVIIFFVKICRVHRNGEQKFHSLWGKSIWCNSTDNDRLNFYATSWWPIYYRRQSLYKILGIGIWYNLVDGEFWNERDNPREQSLEYASHTELFPTCFKVLRSELAVTCDWCDRFIFKHPPFATFDTGKALSTVYLIFFYVDGCNRSIRTFCRKPEGRTRTCHAEPRWPSPTSAYQTKTELFGERSKCVKIMIAVYHTKKFSQASSWQ